MIDAVILAGGCSVRFKSNKLLFPINDKPLIIHTIESLKDFVSHIYVVTGHYHDEITEVIKNIDKVSIIYNPNYMNGMFSSVQVGIKATNNDILLIPGDCPFVNEKTIQQLIDGKGLIRCPAYKGKNGHPLFIKKELKEEILKLSSDSNLKTYRDQIGYEIIDCDDPHIFIDIDTIKDYQNLSI